MTQHLPCLGPVRGLDLIFGFEGSLAVLRRLQGRLVVLLLVGQLLGQAVTLLSQGGALGLLGAKGGQGSAQLAPQVSIGPCRYEERSCQEKIRPDYSAVGPNLRDYTQWVR